MSRYDVLLTNPPAPSLHAAGPAPEVQDLPSPPAQATSESRVPTGEPATPEAASEQSDQSTSRPVDRPTRSTSSGIVPRPKAFYITLRLDARLDEAVRYFQEVRGIPKADRSAIVNALLDRDELWTERALNDLAAEVIDRLTNRLTR